MNKNRKKENKNITFHNIFFGFVLQIVNIINGFIMPKIILSNFGSELNGLVSSLNQFLGYTAVLEGGITGVIVASLYKPLVKNDIETISSILKTAKSFFNKITTIIICYSLCLCIIYPMIVSGSINKTFIITLIIILSLRFSIQTSFIYAEKSLIVADGKIYVISIIQSISIIVELILVYISVKIYPSIHLVKILSIVSLLIQPILIKIFINNNYKINKKAVVNEILISNRWSAFSINISSIIHYNLDMVILSIFTNLSTVSVYSVYYIVVSGLEAMINVICTSFSPILGKAYANKDSNIITNKFRSYEAIITLTIFVLYTTASLLITPFVMTYTLKINDANYYEPLFGLLLLISNALYLLKNPHQDLAFCANKFKEMEFPVLFESVINIVSDIIFTNKFGLIGIPIGSIIAMIYRLIYQVSFTKKIIEQYDKLSFLKKIIVYSLLCILIYYLCSYCIKGINYSYLSILSFGFIYFIITLISFCIVAICVFKDNIFNNIKELKNGNIY